MKPRNKKYRPICPIDELSKTLETLIKVRPEEELDRNMVLNDHQFGFRSKIDIFVRYQSVHKKRLQHCPMGWYS